MEAPKADLSKCFFCKKAQSPSNKLCFCSRCSHVAYCDNGECQHNDYAIHRNICCPKLSPLDFEARHEYLTAILDIIPKEMTASIIREQIYGGDTMVMKEDSERNFYIMDFTYNYRLERVVLQRSASDRKEFKKVEAHEKENNQWPHMKWDDWDNDQTQADVENGHYILLRCFFRINDYGDLYTLGQPQIVNLASLLAIPKVVFPKLEKHTMKEVEEGLLSLPTSREIIRKRDLMDKWIELIWHQHAAAVLLRMAFDTEEELFDMTTTNKVVVILKEDDGALFPLERPYLEPKTDEELLDTVCATAVRGCDPGVVCHLAHLYFDELWIHCRNPFEGAKFPGFSEDHFDHVRNYLSHSPVENHDMSMPYLCPCGCKKFTYEPGKPQVLRDRYGRLPPEESPKKKGRGKKGKRSRKKR